jgi:hypothetical protein
VPYVSPPPSWMSGKEALAHIRQTDSCPTRSAISQLKAALSDGQIGARLPDPNSPSRSAIFPPGADQSIFAGGGRASRMTSIGCRQIPGPKQWRTAKIRANGTARFFGEGSPPYSFEVLRENVLRLWPASQSRRIKRTSKKTPVANGIKGAIEHLWQSGIPLGLKPKHRDNLIFHWLKENDCSIPAQVTPSFSRAVQRVLKSLS